MNRIDLTTFPAEEDLLDSINDILVFQCEHGAANAIAKEVALRVLEHPQGKDLDDQEKELQLDTAGVNGLVALFKEGVHLRDMTVSQRDAIALLWTNYMCDQEYGQVSSNVWSMMESGKDYKRLSLEMVKAAMEEDPDDATYSGVLIYLWTLICMVRIVKNAARIGGVEMPEPHKYRNTSLN